MRDRPNDRHRQIAAARLGRKLGTDEVVHHEDEDKSNDAPGNLTVKSRSAHTADHNRGRNVSKLRKALTMHRRGEKLY